MLTFVPLKKEVMLCFFTSLTVEHSVAMATTTGTVPSPFQFNWCCYSHHFVRPATKKCHLLSTPQMLIVALSLDTLFFFMVVLQIFIL